MRERPDQAPETPVTAPPRGSDARARAGPVGAAAFFASRARSGSGGCENPDDA